MERRRGGTSNHEIWATRSMRFFEQFIIAARREEDAFMLKEEVRGATGSRVESVGRKGEVF